MPLVTLSSPTQIPAAAADHRHHLPPEKLAQLIDDSKSLRHLTQIHAAVLRRGLDHHHILSFKLLRSYSALDRLDYSAAIFRRTPNPTVFSYTAIIHCHVTHRLHHQAQSFYNQMITDGVEPNAFTLSAILKSSDLIRGREIHTQAVKYGLDSDVYVGTGLIDVYAKGGDFGSARQMFDKMPEKSLVSFTTMMTYYAKNGNLNMARLMFDEMPERDLVCWNVMIDGYSQHGSPNEALDLFRKMLWVKMRPNEVTLLAVLSACGQIGALELGRWVHSYIENNKIGFNIHVGSALVDMYGKCGSLEDARLVFDRITKKDVVVWNSMIVGYSIHGFTKNSLDLFNIMCAEGVCPTDITFIGILSACAHGGLVEEGRRFFSSMINDFGIEPKIEHFGCMVNLLGRAGLLDEAYGIIKKMKIHRDVVLWGTLLAACRLHGNVELGEEIAEFLVREKLANSGTFVLLSNIYAARGNWDGVAKARSLMRESGVEKEPGCSSIELNNKVHEFLAGDLRHPKSKEIYIMLEEINKWLKAHGYTPQIDIVLHDLGEMEKKRSLEVHSEKLAISYGLISTKPGTTIRIVKNLRVCLDCHIVTKLISKITGRKIIVRDRNRFHHFVDGSCSCGDYW